MEKGSQQFSKDRAAKDGLKFSCKNCDQQYKIDNKQKIKEQNVNYYKTNKEEIDERHKKHYNINKEDISERHKKWREQNPQYSIAYRKANKYTISKQIKKWRKDNPEKLRAYDAKRRSLKLNQTSPDSDQDKILEFYKEAQQLTVDTKTQHHVDHIIPLSKGGLHHQDNLQILTAKENLRKGSKLLWKTK